jgi:hypothetical protein
MGHELLDFSPVNDCQETDPQANCQKELQENASGIEIGGGFRKKYGSTQSTNEKRDHAPAPRGRAASRRSQMGITKRYKRTDYTPIQHSGVQFVIQLHRLSS